MTKAGPPPFPFRDRPIRLAMVGMVEGNGHPYSWSAIFNGFDPDEMAKCPYPVIPVYLSRQPKETLRIPGVTVTHIWTDDPEEGGRVARASLIPHQVSRPEDVIGKVDAVIIPTDKGGEHVKRSRIFLEAGIPLFVDKPLVDNENDLMVFGKWVAEGRVILSSSCMRYAKEFLPYRESTREFGALRFVTVTTPKSWERYGVHALEGAYAVIGSGFVSGRHSGTAESNIVHFRHRSGTELVAAAIADMTGSFGVLGLFGTQGHVTVSFNDTYYAFKKQLEAFVTYLRVGTPPFPFSETEELMKMIVAGIRSREEGGREVFLNEIKSS